jgi:hypothetical protein
LIDVASINALGESETWALRMGVHITASIWVVGTSLQMAIIPLAVGVVLGVLLALHAIAGPKLPYAKQKLCIFVLPAMTAWLGLIAFA